MRDYYKILCTVLLIMVMPSSEFAYNSVLNTSAQVNSISKLSLEAINFKIDGSLAGSKTVLDSFTVNNNNPNGWTIKISGQNGYLVRAGASNNRMSKKDYLDYTLSVSYTGSGVLGGGLYNNENFALYNPNSKNQIDHQVSCVQVTSSTIAAGFNVVANIQNKYADNSVYSDVIMLTLIDE